MITNIIPLPFVLWMPVKNGRAEDERQRYFVGYVAGMGVFAVRRMITVLEAKGRV